MRFSTSLYPFLAFTSFTTLEHIHKTGTLHRDISVPNIMIDAAGSGQLADFDLAREEAARQPTHAASLYFYSCVLNQLLTAIFQGTWQFISTARLLDPNKRCEVSDVLESLFFVILYEGIHWVTHNKPTLDPRYLFDEARTYAGGSRIIGGNGKFRMYTFSPHMDAVLHKLRFERSPPFADLLRELFLLFESLAIVSRNKKSGEKSQDQDASNVEKLENYRVVIQLMKNAVERVDWPEEHDKALSDNYPDDRGVCWDLTG